MPPKEEVTLTNTIIPVWEEHLFWLEILQDHAYFVRDHLSPSEKESVKAAQQYIQLFTELIDQFKKIPRASPYTDEAMVKFAQSVWPVAQGYFTLEGTLQALRIDNKINLNLSPTYLNGTLAENQEYLRLLAAWSQGKNPAPLPLIDLMDLWLEDQLGHVTLFQDLLDPIELLPSRQAEEYSTRFRMYIVQNHHLKGYLRFKEPGFARQREFAYEVGKTTLEMNHFVYTMVMKYQQNKLLNKSTLRFLEHHFPETCYFIKKLSHYAPKLQPEAAKCALIKPAYTS